ncbi:uncharacterized protein RAG0_00904 [Rhynchosporium agropyri]|uniref:Copper-fist domain-containing protein n=1 Tax=Rhynchosporium agropyri TaxID=914238 RepID=A0A1E1JZ49_9HELO|nr:uncharacterized protein RAG0_00904 [Rhynchosporium agropyri]
MPLINGCKYSCEPCIRGHRASSCAHTDRILIEVRKPGRPLETCGHNLNTCQCGRVAEVIAMNDILSDASAGTFGMENNSNFVVTTPPMPVGSYASIRRPKPRTKSQSKVTKRSKRKTFTPPASPVDEASSKLASISAVSQPEQPQDEIPTDSTRKERLDPLSPPGQSDVNSQPMQYILPNPHQYQLLGSGQGAYMNYPSGPGESKMRTLDGVRIHSRSRTPTPRNTDRNMSWQHRNLLGGRCGSKLLVFELKQLNNGPSTMRDRSVPSASL